MNINKMRASAGLLALLVAAVRPLSAQGWKETRAAVSARPVADTVRSNAAPPLDDRPWRVRAAPLAPIVSGILPGAGQFIQRNDRFIGYVAVEALAWLKYRKDKNEQAAEESSYKDLARRVARANFSTSLPDGPWHPYYEAMRDWIESGRYSVVDGGPVIPESDPSTYNGYKWNLALSTHCDVIAACAGTQYAAALADYEQQAIKPEFRWSWRNAQLAYDLYSRTTSLRNDAAAAAARDLAVVAANHVLSMVDAFTTFRLRAQRDASGRSEIGATILW